MRFLPHGAAVDTASMMTAITAAQTAASNAQTMASNAGASASASATKVAEMEAAPYMRGTRGKFTINAALGVAAVVDFPVTFDKALPNTTYNAVVGFEGSDGGILGALTAMVKAGSKTTTGCTITIKNTALVSLGLNVVVTVVALY